MLACGRVGVWACGRVGVWVAPSLLRRVGCTFPLTPPPTLSLLAFPLHLPPPPSPVDRYGYWADENQFDLFDKCVPEKACPGYGLPCAQGYTGVKCGFCAKRYVLLLPCTKPL